MQVAGLSNNSWLQQLQQDLLGANSASAASGQSLPVAGQGSTSSDDSTQAAGQASSLAPVFGGSLLSSVMLAALFGVQAPTPAQSSSTSSPDGSSSTTAGVQPASTSPGTPGASLLGSNVLSNLFDMQQQQPSTPAMALAGQIIQADGSNGELSLAQITSALTSANGTAPNATALQTVFNQLDTDGDGELNQAELAAGISQMMQQQQSTQTPGMHHHHHHHGGGENGSQTMQPDSTTSSSSTTTVASATTTGATDSADGTSSTTPAATPATS